jgi:hypothetical protein
MVTDKDSNVLKNDAAVPQEGVVKPLADAVAPEAPEPQQEAKKEVIQPEVSQQEQVKLRGEIEKVEVSDAMKAQVQDDSQSIAKLDEEKKMKQLLALAEKKGVTYAVKVAQSMDDPYLLDKFHDLLIEKGYYKQFTK